MTVPITKMTMRHNVRGQRPPEARSAGGGPTAPRCYASKAELRCML